MRVIPVLDLKNGRAVHARAGLRDAYAAVVSPLVAEPGDALALARAYREQLGLEELYVADLDAITGGRPQREMVRALARVGSAVMLDAGATNALSARALVGDGVARVIVGLETLVALEELEVIARALGRQRVVFSLDLVNGAPVTRPDARVPASPAAIADGAVDAGAGAVIVLDLARVGTGSGVDLALIARLAAALARRAPDVELIAGGGVRDRADLARLADAGCAGALVATALHEGRLARADLVEADARRARPGDHRSSSR
jgi:phosphoribosylformimino-5-aminoimidazole carboxamide ribotide isomerase